MAVPPQFQKAHNRMAGKKPTPLSPGNDDKDNPLSSIAARSKKGDGDDKKKAAMLAAFKGKH